MKKIMTIGEAMGLFVADEVGPLEEVRRFTRYTAGAEMNVAIGLSRLGFEVCYTTQFGDDPLGHAVKGALEQERIGTDHVYFTSAATTGLQLKQKVLEGDPIVASYRKNSAATLYSLDLVQKIDLSTFDHIHLAGNFLGLSDSTREVSHFLADRAKELGVRVSFDSNLRPGLWQSQQHMIDNINALACKCEIFLPGIGEGRLLTGLETAEQIADYYLSRGVQSIFIKLGAEGAWVQSHNSNGFVAPGYCVDRIVDTVGAGDGFAVGVISALADGLDLSEAARRGNAIGALQLTVPGDNDGLPDRQTLLRFMEEQPMVQEA